MPSEAESNAGAAEVVVYQRELVFGWQLSTFSSAHVAESGRFVLRKGTARAYPHAWAGPCPRARPGSISFLKEEPAKAEPDQPPSETGWAALGRPAPERDRSVRPGVNVPR